MWRRFGGGGGDAERDRRPSGGSAAAAASASTAGRFTLAQLRALSETLSSGLSGASAGVSDAELIAALARLAECMVYGDKSDDAFFLFFGEKRLMGTLVALFRARSSFRVRAQIIQSVAIILQNVRKQASLFYLLSNNHVNDLVGACARPSASARRSARRSAARSRLRIASAPAQCHGRLPIFCRSPHLQPRAPRRWRLRRATALRRRRSPRLAAAAATPLARRSCSRFGFRS